MRLGMGCADRKTELTGISSGCTNCAAAVHLAASRGHVVIFSASPFESSYWTWSRPSG
jgi:hypothetical protein